MIPLATEAQRDARPWQAETTLTLRKERVMGSHRLSSGYLAEWHGAHDLARTSAAHGEMPSAEDQGPDRVIVIPMDGGWAGHFTFDVVFNGVRRMFRGVPNYCDSPTSARARGAWRLKWLREGKFGEQYGPAVALPGGGQ